MAGQTFLQWAAAFASRAGHWRLGETSGTNAANQETGPAGTYTGGYTLNQTGIVTGDAAKSTLLDGTNGYIAIADDASLDLGDVFTYLLPLKRTRTLYSDYEILFTKGTGSAVGLVYASDDRFALYKNGGGEIVASTATIDDTNPHVLAFVKNGATVALYLDGVDVTGSVANDTITNTTDPLHLGADSGFNALAAYVQDVVVFGTALSAANIVDGANLLLLGPLTAGTLSYGTVTGTTVDLSWVASTGGTPTRMYQVQRAPDVAGSAGTYVNIGSAQSGTTYTDNAPLVPGTKYWWRVITTDGEVVPQTDTSNAVTTTTTAATLTTGTLSLGTVASSSVDLSWTASTGGVVPLTYQLQRAPDASGSAGTYANVGASQSGLTKTDSPLAASTKYWWRIVTSDSTSGTPQTVTSTPVTTTTSSAPGGSAATIGRTLAETILAHASIGFYHRFNDTSGTAAVPAFTGTGGTNGTYEGATLNQPGGLVNAPGNLAVSVPGTSPNRVYFPNRAAFDTLTPTIFLVVKPTLLSNGYQALWSKGQPSTGCYLAPDNTLLVACPGVGTFVVSNVAIASASNFVTIAWQYNGTTVNRLTINGTDVTASPVYVVGFGTNTHPLAFGSNAEGDNEWSAFTYDEFALFTVATSNAFVTDLANLAGSGPLTAPAVTVVSTTDVLVNLSWPAATGGTPSYLYQVQRAPDVAGSPGTWANVGGTQSGLTKQDSGRTPSTTYHYRVQVIGSEATPQTASSASVPATTGPASDTTPPVVTIDTTTGITSTTATINTHTNEPAQIWVEAGTASGNYAAWPGSWKPAAPTSPQTFPLSGLPPNTVIHWRVKGRDASGNESAFSADQTLTTSPDTPLSSDPALVTSGPTISPRADPDTTATIVWTTDVPTWGQVVWGSVNPATGAAYANATDVDRSLANLSTSHSVTFPPVEGVANYWAAVSITEATRETITPGATTIFRTAIPPVVSNVQVTPASTTAVVTWDTDEATVQDKVDYGLTTGYGNQAVITGTFPAGTGHSVTLSPLQPSMHYFGRVRSTDAAGAESAGNTFQFDTQAAAAPVPLAPSNLTATAILFSQVGLSWVDNDTTETGQVLERATGAGAFAQIQALGPNVITATDATVTPGATHSYRVRAFNASGNSPYSNTLVVPVPPAPVIPAAPSGLTATPNGATQVTVAWTDNATTETSYQVERGPSSTGPFTVVAPSLAANAVGYVDTSVVSVTTYWYRARAVNADGASAYSNVDDATTPSSGADTTPPTLSAIVATPASTSLQVAWSTLDEVSDSQVEYGLTTAYGTVSLLNSALVISHSVTLPGLSPSTLYHFRVKSRDASGNLATSADQTATTSAPPDITPPTITLLQVTAVTASSVTLTWHTNEACTDAVDYGTTTAYGASTSVDPTLRLDHARTVPGLTASTLYHLRVRSADAAGNVQASGDLTAMTLAASGGTGTLPDPPASGTRMAGAQVLLALATRPIEAPIWIDMSSRLEAWEFRRGTDNELSAVSAGTGTVTLDNRDRALDPTNTAGPYYGLLKRMRRIKLRCGWDAVGYDQITGYIEDFPQEWDGPAKSTVTLPFSDGFAVLALHTLNRPFSAAAGDVRVNEVLDDAGWTTGAGWLLGHPTQSVLGTTTVIGSTGDRLISQTDAQLQAAVVQQTAALSHLQAVEATERGLLFMAKEGQVRLRSRHELQQLNASVGYAIFGEQESTGELLYVDALVNAAGDVLYNRARITRENSQNIQQWQDDASVYDYYARTYSATVLLTSDEDALAYAQAIVNRYKAPLPVIPSLELHPAYQPALLWPHLLGRELGDVITVRKRPPGGGPTLEQKSRIVGIACSFVAGGVAGPDAAQWAFSWRLAAVGQEGTPWVLGSLTASILGSTTRLVY